MRPLAIQSRERLLKVARLGCSRAVRTRHGGERARRRLSISFPDPGFCEEEPGIVRIRRIAYVDTPPQGANRVVCAIEHQIADAEKEPDVRCRWLPRRDELEALCCLGV